MACELPVLTLSWLFHTHWALCANIYSRGLICHSSVGCAVQSLVIARASHTDLPGGFGIIHCALIMGPCIWSHRGCVTLISPLFLNCDFILWSCTCCLCSQSTSVATAYMPSNSSLAFLMLMYGLLH